MASRNIYFKTLRQDDYGFWSEFLNSLANRSLTRLKSSKELRKQKSRKNWTNRLAREGGKYETVASRKQNPRRPQLYSPQERLGFTPRHQSCSLAVIGRYFPPAFGWSKERKDLLVGVCFDEKDVLLQRLMMYDGGTYGRPYDFYNKEDAEHFLRKMLRDKVWHTTAESLAAEGILRRDEGQYNEVMARLRWNVDGTSKIVIFSNSDESRLLAQIRALDLKKKFLATGLCTEEYKVPIGKYDANNPFCGLDDYSLDSRIADLEKVRLMKNNELDKLLRHSAISKQDLLWEHTRLRQERDQLKALLVPSIDRVSDETMLSKITRFSSELWTGSATKVDQKNYQSLYAYCFKLSQVSQMPLSEKTIEAQQISFVQMMDQLEMTQYQSATPLVYLVTLMSQNPNNMLLKQAVVSLAAHVPPEAWHEPLQDGINKGITPLHVLIGACENTVLSDDLLNFLYHLIDSTAITQLCKIADGPVTYTPLHLLLVILQNKLCQEKKFVDLITRKINLTSLDMWQEPGLLPLGLIRCIQLSNDGVDCQHLFKAISLRTTSKQWFDVVELSESQAETPFNMLLKSFKRFKITVRP